jgi:hypothetical protein
MPAHGWASSHVCVSAAAAGIAGLKDDPQLVSFLRRKQKQTGEWQGYWWCDSEYATALALESLNGTDDYARAAERAAGYAISRPMPASPFVQALRIRILLTCGCAVPADSADALAQWQLPDGSWPSSARLRIPPPMLHHPSLLAAWDSSHKGFGSIVVDQNRIFTTATVVSALAFLLGRA